MPKYMIKHDRPGCIGCAACAAISPENWEMNEDGLSDCKGAKKLDDGTEEKDFEEDDLAMQKECAEACPVNVIHIIDKKTGEKLI